jgi:hypothetical protein
MVRNLLLLSLVSLLFTLTGCQSARYILKEGDHGIIAIPNNSNWPVDHRANARELMDRHFPNGYVIDREEEIAVGNELSTHAGEFSTVTLSQDTTEWRISYRQQTQGTEAPQAAVE